MNLKILFGPRANANSLDDLNHSSNYYIITSRCSATPISQAFCRKPSATAKFKCIYIESIFTYCLDIFVCHAFVLKEISAVLSFFPIYVCFSLILKFDHHSMFKTVRGGVSSASPFLCLLRVCPRDRLQ